MSAHPTINELGQVEQLKAFDGLGHLGRQSQTEIETKLGQNSAFVLFDEPILGDPFVKKIRLVLADRRFRALERNEKIRFERRFQRCLNQNLTMKKQRRDFFTSTFLQF